MAAIGSYRSDREFCVWCSALALMTETGLAYLLGYCIHVLTLHLQQVPTVPHGQLQPHEFKNSHQEKP